MFQTRLKELRESLGLSQASFAQKFGVAQSTVGNWESGTREPNFSIMQKIADFFGVSVDYLLGRTNSTEQNPRDQIGLRIKTLREGYGLTQLKFSQKTNLPLRTIKDWENLKKEPNLDQIHTLTSFFECGTEYLLGLNPYRFEDNSADSEEKENITTNERSKEDINSNEKKLLLRFRQLSPEQQEALLEILFPQSHPEG